MWRARDEVHVRMYKLEATASLRMRTHLLGITVVMLPE